MRGASSSTADTEHRVNRYDCRCLDAGDLEGLVDLFADADYDAPDEGALEIELEGYGYRWFRARLTG